MKNFFFLSLSVLLLISNIKAQPGFEPDTIFVSAGWNLIGSKFTGAVSEIITTEPPDIISSPFYKYSLQGGYSASDTLEKSTGYWVKISNLEASGSIIISMPHILFICGHPTRRGLVWYGDRWYRSVQIGTQCWLKSNLDIGTFIDSDSANQINNGLIEKYCYGDDESNCETYGGLYHWGEAMQYEMIGGARGICPIGWHIPTYQEYLILKDYVDEDGNALKSIGVGTGAGAGTNTSKFSALLAGNGSNIPVFYELNEATYLWSSSFSSGVISLKLVSWNSSINISNNIPDFWYGSVRCIKND